MRASRQRTLITGGTRGIGWRRATVWRARVMRSCSATSCGSCLTARADVSDAVGVEPLFARRDGRRSVDCGRQQRWADAARRTARRDPRRRDHTGLQINRTGATARRAPLSERSVAPTAATVACSTTSVRQRPPPWARLLGAVDLSPVRSRGRCPVDRARTNSAIGGVVARPLSSCSSPKATARATTVVDDAHRTAPRLVR